MDGLWTPSRTQIGELEKRLPSFVNGITTRPPARPLDWFWIQYVGFLRNGRKLVEVNAIPRDMPPIPSDLDEHFLDLTADAPPYRSWAEKRLVERIWVSDGGAAFWGVEYDPATMTFSRYETNDSAP